MSSDIPLPSPDPHVEDSWFQRPAVLATCALIVVLIGTVLWFVAREAETATDPTIPSAVTTAIAGTGGGGSTTSESGAPTSNAASPTTVGTAVNPFGDAVGAPVMEERSQAAQFAFAVQRRGDPAIVAALHSPAYYYALWATLTSPSEDAAAVPVATQNGYDVEVGGSRVELVDLRPAAGLVRDGAEIRNGVVTPLEVAVQSTGVCQPDREPQCDLSGSNFAPDAGGSIAQMWALAKVVVEPAAHTWLVYVDLHGPQLASVTVDGSIAVAFDPALNIVAVTYDKQQPPGTVFTLRATADDGTSAAFDFAVS